MKKDLHPKLAECSVTCACGNTFTIKSVKESIRLDICDKCHPFYTGSEKSVDTTGRVEKFNKKYGLA
ncbi:MAG: 50S ribosomal protein L31 [Helicobacteraceae bacterium]|jgi:large subunit ribosomal protein L31|nr:50S ribosomal protein L31 [Helicobacteraceae bacterium]